MSTPEIKQAIEAMAEDERARLTVWMVSRYPVLRVEQLMGRAAEPVARGEWALTPPTAENRPQGERRCPGDGGA